ncbi:MAG: hypothetical protein [Bacteriophage sp.]|nr:MAG: hypothetical protein [Bacteriophage sp.]
MKSFTKAKRRFLANGIVVIEKCVDAVRPVFIRAKDEFEQFEVELWLISSSSNNVRVSVNLR